MANATSYELFEKLGENNYNSLETGNEINFDVSALGLEEGKDHILVVKAHASGYTSSEYSNEVVFTVGASGGSGGSTGGDTSTVSNPSTLVALCGDDVWVDYASVDVAQTSNPPIVIDATRTNRIGAYFIKVPSGMTISCTSNYLLNVTEHTNPTSESYTGKISGWLTSYTPTAGTYAFIHLRSASNAAATYSPGVVGVSDAYNSVSITISGASSLACAKSTSGDMPVYTITGE